MNLVLDASAQPTVYVCHRKKLNCVAFQEFVAMQTQVEFVVKVEVVVNVLMMICVFLHSFVQRCKMKRNA